jgi:DNA-binding PadR family transcriptional regulator
MVDAARKVDNPLALAVLALLSERPMHPYEIVTELRRRHKHEHVRLRYSSLYSAVEALQRAAFVVPHETRREGRRPERTTYALTDAGRAELAGWLMDLLRRPVKEYPRFTTGLTFATRLPSDEVATLLEERARILGEALWESQALREQLLAEGLPRRVLIELEYESALQDAELRWIDGLVRDLRSGALAWEGYLS